MHATSNTDKIRDRNIFFKSGLSKDKKPVFYLIPRRFRNNDPSIDISTLLYYILKVKDRQRERERERERWNERERERKRNEEETDNFLKWKFNKHKCKHKHKYKLKLKHKQTYRLAPQQTTNPGF